MDKNTKSFSYGKIKKKIIFVGFKKYALIYLIWTSTNKYLKSLSLI